jgi:hypothetical protein
MNYWIIFKTCIELNFHETKRTRLNHLILYLKLCWTNVIWRETTFVLGWLVEVHICNFSMFFWHIKVCNDPWLWDNFVLVLFVINLGEMTYFLYFLHWKGFYNLSLTSLHINKHTFPWIMHEMWKPYWFIWFSMTLAWTSTSCN